MKRVLSALLVLCMCLGFACAEAGDAPAPQEAAQVTPVPEATAVPTQESSAEPTQETATAEPSQSPAAEPTAVPSTEPTPASSEQPTAAPSATPTGTPVPSGDCWLLDDSNARVERGSLSEILRRVGKMSVQVSTKETVVLRDFPLAHLSEIRLTPDPEDFSGDWRVVCARSSDIGDEITQEQMNAFAQDELGDVYIWVVEVSAGPTATPTAQPTQAPLKLTVDARDYRADAWSCVQPRFVLSGIPEGDRLCSYVAVVLTDRFIVLSDGEYVPLEEGVYALRFALLDGMGDVADKSETYALRLDYTAPELTIEPSATKNYSMTISMSDSGSGLDALSLDGGETWIDAGNLSTYEYTAKKKTVFPANTILLRDLAGNVSANETEITLAKLSYGGGGGGSSDATKKKEHASGSGDTTVYNTYDLQLPEGEMKRLAFGGEEVDLTLAANGEPAQFSGSLVRWARSATAVDTADVAATAPDTLVLAADTSMSGGDVCAYSWKVNGAVLRKLYNSDIAYLALRAGDSMVSLPTAGFSGGTRYAEMKMEGVSTAAFEYEIQMTIAPDMPSDPLHPGTVSITATVNGERFEMRGRTETPEMYLCDVWDGPADMPDYPYGAYPGLAETKDAEE